METPTATEKQSGPLTDQDVYNALERYDAGEEITLPEESAPAAKQPAEPSKSPENEGPKADEADGKTPQEKTSSSETSPEKPADEAGKKPEGEVKEQGEDEDDPDASPYTRAKKDAERLDKTWKSVNQRKAELEERERQLAEREEQIKKLQQEGPRQEGERDQRAPTRRSEKLGSKEYLEAAKVYEAEGEYEKANAARQLADEARQAEQQEDQQQQQQFQAEWDKNLQAVLASPEYADMNDPQSPLGQNVQKVLKEEPMLRQIPDGIRKAAWVGKAFTMAERVPELEGQIAEKDKEIERLRNQLALPETPSPEDGGSPPPSAPTHKEEGSAILNQLAEYDQQRVGTS